MSDLPLTLALDAEGIAAYLVEVWPAAAERFAAGSILDLTPTSVRLRRSPAPDEIRPGGTVSGPMPMSMADSASWIVLLGRLGRAALAVTSSLSIDFLRRPRFADLVADAELVKLGRSLAVCSVRISNIDEAGGIDPSRPVAIASVTYGLTLLHGDPPDREDAPPRNG